MKHNKSKSIRSSTVITNWRRTVSCYEFSFLEFLATKISFFYRLLTSWRKPIFLKEIKMAKVSSKDKVLHIGCGLLPSASISIAEETNAKVVGIDNNNKALKFAQQFVDKSGLSDLIKIEYGDGVEYPVQDFDVIFIAINVWPIDTVLKHLLSQIKKDTRIICKGMKNDITDLLEKEGLHDMFSVNSVSEHPKTQSFLLTKK